MTVAGIACVAWGRSCDSLNWSHGINNARLKSRVVKIEEICPSDSQLEHMIRIILPAWGSSYKTRHDNYLALPYIDRSSFAVGLLRPFFSLEFAPSNVKSNTVLDSGFHTVDLRFQVLDSIFFVSWNLDSRLQSLARFWIPSVEFLIPKLWIPNSTSKSFPGFRIPQAKMSWISESDYLISGDLPNSMVLLLFSTSNQYGTTTLQDSSASTTLTIGSKSKQTSAGEYYMRSLAVWKRALSSQEVKGIYLAGKFICLGIWKDECNVLR